MTPSPRSHAARGRTTPILRRGEPRGATRRGAASWLLRGDDGPLVYARRGGLRGGRRARDAARRVRARVPRSTGHELCLHGAGGGGDRERDLVDVLRVRRVQRV